jgi:hypothetical protein
LALSADIGQYSSLCPIGIDWTWLNIWFNQRKRWDCLETYIYIHIYIYVYRYTVYIYIYILYHIYIFINWNPTHFNRDFPELPGDQLFGRWATPFPSKHGHDWGYFPCSYTPLNGIEETIQGYSGIY